MEGDNDAFNYPVVEDSDPLIIITRNSNNNNNAEPNSVVLM